MSTPAIQVEKLTKYYGAIRGVEDISFSVAPGEIVGLLGPNGSGKTTMMRMLTCYFTPTSGFARVMGRDCVDQSLQVKRVIGYLPENPLLYHEMRVEDYLWYIAELRDVPGSERPGRVQCVVEQLDLTGVRRAIIGRLSKGFKQRVGLAGALVHDPQVVILDEPTVGLDPRQILEFRDLLKSLGGGKTVVLSSHILPEVQQMCDRMMIVNKGRLVAIATREELLSRAAGANRLQIKVRADSAVVTRKLESVDGVRSVVPGPVEEGIAQFLVEGEGGKPVQESIAKLALQERWVIVEIRSVDLSLEEVFLDLTGDKLS